MEIKKNIANFIFLWSCFFDNKKFSIVKTTKFNSFLFILFALCCFAIFLPFYPGIFSNADTHYYFKAASGINAIYYWHAPFLQYFWRFLGFFGAFFLFNIVSYWLGTAITAYALFDSIYARLSFMLIFGFFPANLNFINYILADSVIFSALILAMSFIFVYVFRAKKAIYLWLALIGIFIVMGLKQNMVIYSSFVVFMLSFLMFKHYVRYYQLPYFSYMRKSHIVLIFIISFSILFGGVSYINNQYQRNDSVSWVGLIYWDLKATSVYSRKNLFYPTLIKPELQHAISSAELFSYVKKELNPFKNALYSSVNTNKYVKSFASLTKSEKIYILNQLASNPIAYLFHRLVVAKAMLNAKPFSNYVRGDYWTSFGITFPQNELTNSLKPFFIYLTHFSFSVLFFYQIIMLVFVLALLKIPPFNTYHNKPERIIILYLSYASFLLFMALVFVSPASNFRYFTSALYSAEISVVLLIRAVYTYCCLPDTWVNLCIFFKQWGGFTRPRLKFIVLFIFCVLIVVAITRHNKIVLRNHFSPIVLNNRIHKKHIPEYYKTLSANSAVMQVENYTIYLNQQMLILKKNACSFIFRGHSFFLHVVPKHRWDIYLGRLLQGYDIFNNSFKKNGIKIPDQHTCLVMFFLPQYEIKHITVEEMNPEQRIVWQTNLYLSAKRANQKNQDGLESRNYTIKHG